MPRFVVFLRRLLGQLGQLVVAAVKQTLAVGPSVEPLAVPLVVHMPYLLVPASSNLEDTFGVGSSSLGRAGPSFGCCSCYY